MGHGKMWALPKMEQVKSSDEDFTWHKGAVLLMGIGCPEELINFSVFCTKLNFPGFCFT